MQDDVGTFLSRSSRVVGQARVRSEAPGARSAARGPARAADVPVLLFPGLFLGLDSSMHRLRAGSLERPIYPFGLALNPTTSLRQTRPMISSGAGGPLTKRSEGPTYVRTATIGCSGWPVPGRDLPGIPFAERRKPRGRFPRPGRGGGVSV